MEDEVLKQIAELVCVAKICFVDEVGQVGDVGLGSLSRGEDFSNLDVNRVLGFISRRGEGAV